VPEYELAEEPGYDEPDRDNGAEDGGAEDDVAEADVADVGTDGAVVPPEPDVPLEPDLGAAGAWVAGAAGGVAGVNDGARSRGVKTDGLFLAESSPVAEVTGSTGVTGGEGEGEATGAVEASLDLEIPSAGSGTAFAVESAAFSAVVTVSSVDVPLAPVTGAVPVRVASVPVDPERELPVLVRDDDMELLSTTASSSATS
jgi:hypothetical protein